MAVEFSKMNYQSGIIGAGLVGGAALGGVMIDRAVHHKQSAVTIAAGVGALGLLGPSGYGLYKQLHEGEGDAINKFPHTKFGFIGPPK